MGYQGEPIRGEGLTARLHRLDPLRVRYRILERQKLALETLQLVARHLDWVPDDVVEALADQWNSLAKEVVRNIGQIWDLSGPSQDDDDSAPF